MILPPAVVEVELSDLEQVGGSEPQLAGADVDGLGIGGPAEAGVLERGGMVGVEPRRVRPRPALRRPDARNLHSHSPSPRQRERARECTRWKDDRRAGRTQ